jgi:hypothetical protein
VHVAAATGSDPTPKGVPGSGGALVPQAAAGVLVLARPLDEVLVLLVLLVLVVLMLPVPARPLELVVLMLPVPARPLELVLLVLPVPARPLELVLLVLPVPARPLELVLELLVEPPLELLELPAELEELVEALALLELEPTLLELELTPPVELCPETPWPLDPPNIATAIPNSEGKLIPSTRPGISMGSSIFASTNSLEPL